ncbi:DoxX family protein [Nonomuraea terrae]|uniref:DoxX family protein n=1 Tax=Nonomuraea terrae TaxID=2530383 RepID=A0A4R4YP33_9ACTN|nr:DoxX family protein [Nonomuraea terrae]TDD46898.1 DoxX family protein [Nonomuraea terrae]
MKRVVFDIAAFIARIATGVIFVAHGWQKWQGGHRATAQGFAEMGIPMPDLAAGYAMAVETIGGVLLIVGLLVRPVALLLLLNMLGAIVFAHWERGVLVSEGGWELAGALGALCLLFLALGGGRLGLDGIFHSMFRRRSERQEMERELAAHTPSRTRTDADTDIDTTDTTGTTGTTGDTTTDDTMPGGTAAGPVGSPEAGQTGGRTTPTEPKDRTDRPKVPHQPSERGAGSKLSDEDMRDIDALIADEPPQHRKPPNR